MAAPPYYWKEDEEMTTKAPLKPCAWPGCNRLVELGTIYCREHEKQYKREHNRTRNIDPFYGRNTWKKVRAKFMKEHPLCEDCRQKGLVTPATEIHHIVPVAQGGERFDEKNLVALCHRCHMARHGKLSQEEE